MIGDHGDPEKLARELVEGMASSSPVGGTTLPADFEAAVRTLYTYGWECWRPLVAGHLGGRCLDAHAGTGRRACLLAQQCESVVALEAKPEKLRVLQQRSDLPTESVRPVRGRLVDALFAGSAFDTVVLELERLRACEDSPAEVLERLEELLAKGGSALVLVNGVATGGGSVTDRVSRWQFLREVRRSARDRKRLGSAAIIGLYPSATQPDYAIDLADRPSRRWFLERELSPDGFLEQAGQRGLALAERGGLLPKVFPGHLLVLAPEATSDRSGVEGGVMLRGRYRSSALDVSERGLQGVQKVPNSLAYGQFNVQEQQAIESVETAAPAIADTLPNGDLRDTAFGEVRYESAVPGRQVRDELDGSPAMVSRLLSETFDWLAQLQGPDSGGPPIQAPTEYVLNVGDRTVEFPAAPPVEAFETTVHGDFNQVNVFVDDGGVSAVIDWEFAELSASPFVDPSNFLFTLAMRLSPDVDAAIDQCFLPGGRYEPAVRRALEEYGDRVGLPPESVVARLPAGLCHRADVNTAFPTAFSLVVLPERLAAQAERLADRLPAIVEAFQ